MSSRPIDRRRLVLGLLASLLLGGAGPGSAAAPDPRLKWAKKWGPLVPHQKFPKDCGLCHLPKRWDALRKDFKFDHFKETGYSLEGAHAQASCLRCHNDRGPVKAYVSRGCGGCHVDPHKSSLGFDCARCHTQTVWSAQGRAGEKLAQHSRTRFPLTGVHAGLQCQQCHVRADSGDYRGASLDCASCHSRDLARGPGHAAAGFPRDCQSCHGTTVWGPGTVMKHQFVSAAPCASCHQADYQRAPNHAAQNFPQLCQNCHTTSSWLGGNPSHVGLGANPNCYGCHQADYAAARPTPASNHSANGFPTACQNCHNTSSWGPGTAMPHSTVSAAPCYTCHAGTFQAAPNHAALNFSHSCQSCHTGTATWLGALYDHSSLGANPVCYTCHQAVYASARPTPASNHSANGFPTTCQNCHNTAAWGPGTAMPHSYVSARPCSACHAADFSAAKATPASNHTANLFPQTCQNCHNTSSWGPGTAMQHSYVSAAPCYTCHAGDFQAAPNHTAQNFSHSCQGCHSGTSTWLGAVYDHSSLGANPVCYNCHQAVYASARPTPASNHPANGFPTTCQNCHNTAAWGPGTPMQHSYVSGTPCYTCHVADFNAANATLSSRHALNSFPRTCQNCHTTTRWGPGTAMPHSYVGGAGSQCQTCHMDDYSAAVSPVNHAAQGISAGACNTCHRSFITWMDFVHTPSNCFNGATGRSHENATCAQCHPGGNYASSSCTACHRDRGSSCD